MKKADFNKIGGRIRRCILKEYVSIEKFAYENNISKKTIYHIINGDRDPRVSTLIKISSCLNISISELIQY